MIITRGLGNNQNIITRGFGEVVESIVAELYRRFGHGRKILIGPEWIPQPILPIGPGPSTQVLFPIRSMRPIGPIRFMRSRSIRGKIRIR